MIFFNQIFSELFLTLVFSRPPEDDNFKPVKNETPTKTTNVVKPDQDYYDRRGAILSARKRTRSSARQLRPKLSDDCNTADDQDAPPPKEIPGTPNKNIETVKVTPEVRRSPRKHASSNKAVIYFTYRVSHMDKVDFKELQ